VDNCKKLLEEHWSLTGITDITAVEAKGNREIRIVHSSEGVSVLKVFDPSLPEKQIGDYTRVLRFLQVSKHALAPALFPTTSGPLYIKHEQRFMYLMEYIAGRQLQETVEDEYALGRAAASLHRISSCPIKASIDVKDRIRDMYARFHDYPFKKEYDRIIESLPNFDTLTQSFIHTDIGPHNAIMSAEGRIVFIDLDDAGQGSTMIDAGYPLITQFIRYYRSTAEIRFDAALAEAFYKGYPEFRKPMESMLENERGGSEL
jgi:Ser/Thr protein kinase RdoA (MazF antagonist)